MNLKDYIRSIPDYPKKGILFRDINTLIKDEKAFSETINQIIERSKKYKIDKIAAIESRGFVFASAVSYLLKKPFILLRKKNKLPAETHSVDFELEYGTATIEVHKDSINKNDSEINEDKTRLVLNELLKTNGVQLAMASTILRFRNPNIYQIIDQRVYRLIYKNKILNINTYPSEKNLKFQIELYIKYLKDLKKICLNFNIPFSKSDRILFMVDKRINKKEKLINYQT